MNDVIYINTEKQGTPVEVAIMYNTSYNENVHSYVNNYPEWAALYGFTYNNENSSIKEYWMNNYNCLLYTSGCRLSADVADGHSVGQQHGAWQERRH